MNLTNDELIINRLDQLMFIIDKLPFSADAIIFIKYIVATDFHHSWQFDEEENEFSYSDYFMDPNNPQFANVKITSGIQNIRQLNRYIMEFISNIKYFNQNVLIDFMHSQKTLRNDLDFRNAEADFRKLSQYEFLKRYKLNFISDLEIDSVIRSNFGSSFPFHNNDQARRKHLPNPINYVSKAMKIEELTICQVDELEFLLCIEATNYLNSKKRKNNIERNDNQYFSNYINTSLFDQFAERSNEKVSNMTQLEANKYFEKSFKQFEHQKPENRVDAIAKIFWQMYRFPESSPKSIDDSSIIYITSIINLYKLHFDKFKKYTEDLLKDYTLKYSQNALNLKKNESDDGICFNDLFPDNLNLKKEELFTFEFNNYLFDWVNCTVTLDQWLAHPKFDVFHHLKRSPLSEKEWERIREHQLCLFLEHSENIFNVTFKMKFENIKHQDNILIAKRDISLINSMILRTITIQEENILKSNFPILFWQTTAKELENIIYGKYESLENYDINKNKYDEYWSYADSMAIYKYKNYLSEFINAYENQQGSNSKKRNGSQEIKQVSTLAYEYKYNQNNSPAITALLKLLKDKLFISNENGISDFRKIFNNQLPDKPIIWIGSFGELHYFVLLMHHEYKVIKKISNIWKVTSELFVDENKIKYEATKFHLQPIPTRATDLSMIVERLKVETDK